MKKNIALRLYFDLYNPIHFFAEEKCNQYRDNPHLSDKEIADNSEVAMVTALQEFHKIRTELKHDAIADAVSADS